MNQELPIVGAEVIVRVEPNVNLTGIVVRQIPEWNRIAVKVKSKITQFKKKEQIEIEIERVGQFSKFDKSWVLMAWDREK